MKGYRKMVFGLSIGVAYLTAVYSLCYLGIDKGADPTALGVMAGGIATGVLAVTGAFVYGNVKEHRNGQHEQAG